MKIENQGAASYTVGLPEIWLNGRLCVQVCDCEWWRRRDANSCGKWQYWWWW